MKKLLSIIFALILMLCCVGCRDIKEDEKTSEINQLISIETQKSEAKNEKAIIDADIKTTRMVITASNDNISTAKKEVAVDKYSKTENYQKGKKADDSICFLGVNYKNIPYNNSYKNSYRAIDNDVYENSEVEYHISQSGNIEFFSTKNPIKLFDDNKNSIELSKKYISAILPNFKYDKVEEVKVDENYYFYVFYKTIGDINTSESVSISLNSKGELISFIPFDVGKYENIEIKNMVLSDYLQEIDKYVNETYDNILIEYNIDDNGPCYQIFDNNKLQISFPIVVNIKEEEVEYNIAENVVFELN